MLGKKITGPTKPCIICFNMVGLSDLNANLFERALRYKHKLDYNAIGTEPQYNETLSLQSKDTSLSKPDVFQERTVKRLIQQQKILNSEEISEMVIVYKSGLTVYQLAKQFGCHRTTVSQHLKAQGIKIRNRPLSEVQIDEAIRLYESGLSCLKIGKIIGANDTTILKRLRERGVRVRGAHER